MEDATKVLVGLEAGAVRSKEAERKLQQKALYRCERLAILAMQSACDILWAATSHRGPTQRFMPEDYHHPSLAQEPAL